MATAEGKVFPYETDLSKIKKEFLETFDFTDDQVVNIESSEFTAVCPFSGLPDIATVIIRYIPKGKAIELKSLKYYFTSYRNIGVFQEMATKLIHDHLTEVLGVGVFVKTVYNTRGGINVVCTKGCSL